MTGSIVERARECHTQFYEHLSQLKSQQADPTTFIATQQEVHHYIQETSKESILHAISAVEDQIGRFNIWAFDSGVFDPLESSLDYSLQDRPDIRSLVLGLLNSLHGNLEQLRTPLIKSDTHGSEEGLQEGLHHERIPRKAEHSEESSPEEMALNNLQAVSDSISRLRRLSNAIQRTSSITHSPDPHSSSRSNEESERGRRRGHEYELQICRSLYPRCSPRLLNRLAHAMLSRRNRIMSRQPKLLKLVSRENKLDEHVRSMYNDRGGGGQEEALNEPDQSENSSLNLLRAANTGTLHAKESQNEKAKENARSLGSLRPLRMHTSSPPLTASSLVNDEQYVELHDLFPPPPNLNIGEKTTCPYCSFTLYSRDIADSTWWRWHVLCDLDAFVCLDEDCNLEATSFSTEEEWIMHIRHEHRVRWKCASKSHRKEGPRIFDKQGDFEKHILSEHEGCVPEYQLPLLVERSARPVGPTFDCCFLCDPDGQRSIKPGDGLISSRLECHVSTHLVSLALHSILKIGSEDELIFLDKMIELISRQKRYLNSFTSNRSEALQKAHRSTTDALFPEKDTIFQEPNDHLGVDASFLSEYIKNPPHAADRSVFETLKPANLENHWLSEHPAFVAWKKGYPEILFLTGALDTGKSYSLRYAISNVNIQLVRSSPVTCFLSVKQTESYMSFPDLECELHVQLLEKLGQFPNQISQSVIKSMSIHDILDLQLQECLRTRGLNIFIDVPKLHDSALFKILETLRLARESVGVKARLKILVACRFLPSTKCIPMEFLEIRVHDHNENEFRNFLRERIPYLLYSSEIEDSICTWANGNFTLAEKLFRRFEFSKRLYSRLTVQQVSRMESTQIILNYRTNTLAL